MDDFFKWLLAFVISSYFGLIAISIITGTSTLEKTNSSSALAPNCEPATPTGAELALKDAQASPKGVISVIGLQPYRLLTVDTRQDPSFSVVPYSYGNHRVSSTPVNPPH